MVKFKKLEFVIASFIFFFIQVSYDNTIKAKTQEKEYQVISFGCKTPTTFEFLKIIADCSDPNHEGMPRSGTFKFSVTNPTSKKIYFNWNNQAIGSDNKELKIIKPNTKLNLVSPLSQYNWERKTFMIGVKIGNMNLNNFRYKQKNYNGFAITEKINTYQTRFDSSNKITKIFYCRTKKDKAFSPISGKEFYKFGVSIRYNCQLNDGIRMSFKNSSSELRIVRVTYIDENNTETIITSFLKNNNNGYLLPPSSVHEVTIFVPKLKL